MSSVSPHLEQRIVIILHFQEQYSRYIYDPLPNSDHHRYVQMTDEMIVNAVQDSTWSDSIINDEGIDYDVLWCALLTEENGIVQNINSYLLCFNMHLLEINLNNGQILVVDENNSDEVMIQSENDEDLYSPTGALNVWDGVSDPFVEFRYNNGSTVLIHVLNSRIESYIQTLSYMYESFIRYVGKVTWFNTIPKEYSIENVPTKGKKKEEDFFIMLKMLRNCKIGKADDLHNAEKERGEMKIRNKNNEEDSSEQNFLKNNHGENNVDGGKGRRHQINVKRTNSSQQELDRALNNKNKSQVDKFRDKENGHIKNSPREHFEKILNDQKFSDIEHMNNRNIGTRAVVSEGDRNIVETVSTSHRDTVIQINGIFQAPGVTDNRDRHSSSRDVNTRIWDRLMVYCAGWNTSSFSTSSLECLNQETQNVLSMDQIENTNMFTIILLDESDSMSGEGLETAIDTCTQIIDHLNGRDCVAIVGFGGRCRIISNWSHNKQHLKDCIGHSCRRSCGTTPLALGIFLSVLLLNKVVGDRSRENVRRRILLFSDGNPTRATSESLTEPPEDEFIEDECKVREEIVDVVLPYLSSHQIQVVCVECGCKNSMDKNFLKKIGQKTNGVSIQTPTDYSGLLHAARYFCIQKHITRYSDQCMEARDLESVMDVLSGYVREPDEYLRLVAALILARNRNATAITTDDESSNFTSQSSRSTYSVPSTVTGYRNQFQRNINKDIKWYYRNKIFHVCVNQEWTLFPPRTSEQLEQRYALKKRRCTINLQNIQYIVHFKTLEMKKKEGEEGDSKYDVKRVVNDS